VSLGVRRICVNADGTVETGEEKSMHLPMRIIDPDSGKVWNHAGYASSDDDRVGINVFIEVPWSSECDRSPAEVKAGQP
jgi:hypothetical protein